jgi:hypothetical protein
VRHGHLVLVAEFVEGPHGTMDMPISIAVVVKETFVFLLIPILATVRVRNDALLT